MTYSYSHYTNSLKRYTNLEEELKKSAYVGQFRKKERKQLGEAAAKTLDRNYFSRIKVGIDRTLGIAVS